MTTDVAGSSTRFWRFFFIGLTVAVGLFLLERYVHGSSKARTADTVWVQKSAGGKSCEDEPKVQASAVALKKAQIDVLESRSGNDGQMHIQMCGADTGAQHEFKIPSSELKAAEKLGFKKIK